MNQQSKFYSSLRLLVVLNLIIKPVWIFLIDRQVQNHVGPAAYGVYFSLLSFSVVFSFLLDWGLTAFFNRQLAAEDSLRNRIGDFLVTRLFFILIYVAAICLIAWLSGIRHWDILWKVTGIQVLTSLFLFLRSIITAQQWFRTDAWLSVLDKLMMILLCGSFLYWPARFGDISIDKFLLVQLIATGFAVVCAGTILLTKGTTLFRINKGFIDLGTFKAVLPFGIIVLLMSAHYRLDGFLLERLHTNGAHEAGLYAGAYRLLDAANMIGYLFASFLLPFIARQHSLSNDSRDVILDGRHLLLLFAVFTALTGIFMAPWIQNSLYHNNDEAAIIIIQLCLPALAGYSLVQVYGTALTATGHIVVFCRIVLFSLVINIILNLLLIPKMGARGACIAALVSQGACGIATMLFAHKKCKTDIHARSLLMYIFIAAIAAAAFYGGLRAGINEWLLVSGAGSLILLLAIFTGLLNGKHWNHFFKQTQPK